MSCKNTNSNINETFIIEGIPVSAYSPTITGGTFNSETDTLTLINSDDTTIAITGFTDYYTTGVTFSNNQLTIVRNDGVEINGFIDNFSGLTVNGNFVSDSISATTYLNLPSDFNTFVTGFTYDNANTLTISDNSGNTFNQTIDIVTGLTVNGGLNVTGDTTLNNLSSNIISATTISGGTYYGDGSDLTNIQNLYNIDGSLQSNRIVNLSGNSLTFSGSNRNVDILPTGQATFNWDDNQSTDNYSVLISGTNITNTTSNSLQIRVGTGLTNTVTSGSRFNWRTLGTNTTIPIQEKYIDFSTPTNFNIGYREDFLGLNITSGTTSAIYNWSFFDRSIGFVPVTQKPLFTINNGGGVGVFNTPIFKIYANGNIGINQYSDAGFKLDVAGTGRFTNTLQLDTVNLNSTDTKILTLSPSNVVQYRNFSDFNTGSTIVVANYLPLSGGTVTGDTIFQSGLTATTISATTYQNLPFRYYCEPSTAPTIAPLSTGVDSIAIGDAAQALSNDMLSFGTCAGFSATTSQCSNFIGFRAGCGVTNSSSANFIGLGAGIASTSASNSNFIGTSAGFNATGSSCSNFIGNSAGFNACNSNASNFIGNSAGVNAASSSCSNFIGFNAGQSNSNSSNSNFIGCAAGQNATGSHNSNFIGISAGINACNSFCSNFIGPIAGQNACNSQESNFIGRFAGDSNCFSCLSTFIGNSAGASSSGSSCSNFIGVIAGCSSINASSSNFIGFAAGFCAPRAQFSNFIGFGAGCFATNSCNSNFIGWGSGFFGSGSSNSNFFGCAAGQDACNSSSSNFIGFWAGRQSCSSSSSNFMGACAGCGAKNLTCSNFIGTEAGLGANGASNSIFIGRIAGRFATGTTSSVFIGEQVGVNSANISLSNFIGCSAGSNALNANSSNFIGGGAGNLSSSSSCSNFIGTNAGSCSPNTFASNFFGCGVGFGATGASCSNFIGTCTGWLTTGSCFSNLIGFRVGSCFTSNNIGNNNIIIGTNISLPNAVSDSINIGGVLFGINTYSTTAGNPSITPTTTGKIGIGVVTPLNRLHVEDTTDPVRLVGLQSGTTDTRILSTDSTGVLRYWELSNITAITSANTYTTAFTYNNNTFTIRDNSGTTFNATINTVTGFTVNGVLSATTISGSTFFGDGSGLTNTQNIYNTNGILTGNRILNLSGSVLDIQSTAATTSRFFSNGNIGIGTTNDSGYKLDVNGTSRFQGTGRFTSAGNNYIDIIANTNTNSPYVHFFYSGVVNRYISIATQTTLINNNNAFLFSSDRTTSNPVGIVGSNVSALSNIEALGGQFYLGGTGDNFISILQRGIANRGVIGYKSGTTYLQIRTNAASSLDNGTLSTAFFSNGNVGINTSIDNGFKFDVSGTGRFTSILQLDTVNSGITDTKILTLSTGNTVQYRNFSDFTADTFTTAFTYNNNTFTLNDNSGRTLTATINTVTGLTVNGNFNVTGTSNLNVVTATSISNVNYIDFNLTGNVAHQEGRIHWNDDTKTLEVDTENNDVHIEVGHENVVRVVNKTGEPLTKGTLVYINGAEGQRPTVTKASYENDNTSARTLGFVAANINNNNNGYVITYGILRDVNTLAYSAGTPIYLFTGGTYTNIRPVAPKHEVRLGYILDQNATTGSIFVNVINGYELTELHDVSATTVNNLDILQWNSSEDVWQPTNTPSFNSISATTYLNLPIDVRVTGASYNNANTFTFTNNTGGTFDVGFDVITGLTINGDLLINGNYTVTGDTVISGATIYSGDVTYNTNATVLGVLSASTFTGVYNSPLVKIGSAYTANTTNSTIEITGGTFNLTLYSSSGNTGRTLYIKNSGTGVVTILPNDSNTIESRTSQKLGQFEVLILQSDGVGNWYIINRRDYTIQFTHEWTSGSAPADTTTYYFGNFMAQAPSTTASSSRQVIAMASGWATYISLMVSVAGTTATSEDSTMLIRNVTTSTSSTFTTTLEHNTASQLLTYTLATPLQITKGDVLEMRWTTPNWGTNPSAVRHIAQVLVN